MTSTPKDQPGTKANDRQVGGDHYQKSKIQHWDYSHANKFDGFQHTITKYVHRWKDKGGVQDLKKAAHCLQKYIELVEAELPGAEPGRTYVNPDL